MFRWKVLLWQNFLGSVGGFFFFGRTGKMAAAFFLVEEPPRVSPGTILANVSRRQENPA